MDITDETVIQVTNKPWIRARDLIQNGQQDSFFLFDVGELVARHYKWLELLPRVKPFYAVKCNNHNLMLATLAALGAGFDCASKTEVQLVSALGVPPESIIFANPAKMPCHIKYAVEAGVFMTTFDSQCELLKIKEHMPQAKLLLRIKCDDDTAKFTFGKKYGCEPLTEGKTLLRLAAELQLQMAGVAFHVGSNAASFEAYARGIRLARLLIDEGALLGHDQMKIVDIGGGFSGDEYQTYTLFEKMAEVVNEALALHFPEDDVTVIAEPGRYYAAAQFTLFASVHTKKEVIVDNKLHTMYFLNDGVYGSFNPQIWTSDVPVCEPFTPKPGESTVCSLWGPTCDSVDCVTPSTRLPALQIGDWLVFRNHGAYTVSCSTNFNGFPPAKIYPVLNKKWWLVIKDFRQLSKWRFVKD